MVDIIDKRVNTEHIIDLDEDKNLKPFSYLNFFDHELLAKSIFQALGDNLYRVIRPVFEEEKYKADFKFWLEAQLNRLVNIMLSSFPEDFIKEFDFKLVVPSKGSRQCKISIDFFIVFNNEVTKYKYRYVLVKKRKSNDANEKE